MDMLFENPLARMYGPVFLFLYILLFLGAFLYVKYILPAKLSSSKNEGGIKLPEQPDPYEIASMWQTENEVLSLVIFNLIRRGYFSLEQKQTVIRIKARSKDVHLLSMIEKDVYTRLDKEEELTAFVRDVYRNSSFRTHAESIRKKLELEKLIWSDDEKAAFLKYKVWIIVCLSFLGLYKLVAAVSHGHDNIMGLIIIAVIGSIFIHKISVNYMPTAKGNKLLEQMKLAFKPVYGNGLLKQPGYIEQILLSVYGFSLLDHSTYSAFYTNTVGVLKPQGSVSIDYSSSGSGCSSGGSSCSSCGGGCGGGCGGCGGCS